VAGVSEFHTDLPPELRQLAQSILDRLDPAVRIAAARASSGSESKCQQVWCPVCALAALVSGEQHPLLTVIAEHSVALLAVVRAMTDAMDPGAEVPAPPTDPSGPDDPTPGGPASGASASSGEPPPGPGHYQHIPVTVEE
jgi:hypothetical protein